MKRRQLLLGTTGLLTTLAGCNTITGNTPENNQDTTNTDTTQNNADISVSISTEAQPSQLPSIWTNSESIEDHQARFSIESSGLPSQVTVSNEKVEIDQDSDQWRAGSVTVQPGQMQNGEQEFTAKAEKNGATAEDTTQASKITPGNYKVDVVPERNEGLRNTIQENSDEDNYLEVRGGFVQEDAVFSSYSSHEAVGFDKLGLDLAAYEWKHDNDYTALPPRQDVETKDWVNSIGTDTGNSDIQAIKNGSTGTTWYPNGNFQQRNAGNFDHESFANAETVGEALDWAHPYLFNWQSEMTDVGPFSAEDSLYAVALEQAVEQKNDNDLEVHAWDVNLGGGHGNGLIYGKNAEGTEELRVMETVANPVTASPQNIHDQLHPLVEDSNYLNPDHEAFQEYWHPLRFGWDDNYSKSGSSFESQKRAAARVAEDMANSSQLTSGDGVMTTTETVAPTTEYVLDFTDKLRNFNDNDADFGELYNQAKMMDKLLRDEENNHIIYGDTENPQYAVVEDDSLVQDVWEDQEGQYDDFNQFLRDNPSYSMSTEEVDATLEGEEMSEEFGQQTPAGP